MLVVEGMTYDTAGTYVCVISVPEIEGMETNATLRVHVRGKGPHERSARRSLKVSKCVTKRACRALYLFNGLLWSILKGAT